MKNFVFAILITFSVFSFSVFAQKTQIKKNTRPTAAATPETAQSPKQTVEEGKTVKAPTKQNQRPTIGNSLTAGSVKTKTESVYFYEFSQPDFVISKILIEHDEAGKGSISFMKKGVDEMISDPVQVSPAAMERINSTLNALNFFDSTENYQYEKDYSHLGNVKIKVKKAGREREAKFNWTQNPEAKRLAEEYRKIGNQYIWIFDMNLARENQPLTAPRLMDALDSFIRRNEVSDAGQMIPFLKELGNDERIPLIARNHAKKLVTQIEKEAAKNEK
jgi:hypothetical protein